jgi:hypothetical protein
MGFSIRVGAARVSGGQEDRARRNAEKRVARPGEVKRAVRRPALGHRLGMTDFAKRLQDSLEGRAFDNMTRIE